MSKEKLEEEFNKFYEETSPAEKLQHITLYSLGHIYSVTRSEIRRGISRNLGLTTVVVTSILYALGSLRNACSHHEPIWYWKAARGQPTMKFPNAYRLAAQVDESNVDRIYTHCAIIKIILERISEKNIVWSLALKRLVNNQGGTYLSSMGFPENWSVLPFWRDEN